MSDFLFHNVSEEEKGEIKEEAKKIMDSFSRRLGKVDEKISEPFVEREEGEREEVDRETVDEDFRKKIFENAPIKNKDFLIAEKKKW